MEVKMGFLSDLFGIKGMKCAACGIHVNCPAEASVQSKKTGCIYFPEMEGSTVKLGPGDKLMKAENISLNKLSESMSNLFCLVCGQRLEEERIKNAPLLDCPDCHKPVSKRANVCVHCGCPIAEIIATQHETLQPAKQEVSSPKCPTCSSDRVERISVANKAGNVALLGVFAVGKVAKTFKCNSCGYQW
jgi:predicted RNA-binding Zn-ribbon protein involved in translation (DUF1610 family)